MNRFGSCPLAGVALVLLAGCATGGGWRGSTNTGRHAPDHYAQSVDSATNACLRNPACYTQTGDEAIIPWATRAMDAARTTATAMELLKDADVTLVEQVLLQCVQDAELQVNNEEFGEGNSPTDEQCKEVVRRERGQDVTRAMDLGTRKHKVASDCIKDRLGERLLRNVTIEPRYKYDPASRRWRMLDPELVAKWIEDQLFDLLLGTLAPDIVIHETGNPNKVQRTYEFKFPCLRSKIRDPGWRRAPGQRKDQRDKYAHALGGEAKPVLISPQLGIQR